MLTSTFPLWLPWLSHHSEGLRECLFHKSRIPHIITPTDGAEESLPMKSVGTGLSSLLLPRMDNMVFKLLSLTSYFLTFLSFSDSLK